jgi:MYXO-CTERM domain-containing protein
MAKRWGALFGCAVLLGVSSAHAAGTVNVTIDASAEHQTWFGFGATHMTLVYGGTGDVLSASLRQQAVDALFNQVKITTGQAPTTFEAPKSSTLETFFGAAANDNADPMTLDPNGFFTGLGDTFKAKVVDIAGSPFDLYPDVKISTKYASKWLAQMEQANYDAFLNECAEQALAGIQYWQTTYGMTPSYAMLFNEPLSGNGELTGGDTQAVVDIVKRTGQRLEANGLSSVKLVVPGEETEEKSLSTASAIMNDPDAAKYVGAIAYHTYPYGSVYSYVPNILSTSGTGNPDASRIQIRKQLRDLGAQHGVPLWMSEVSHAYMQGDGIEATDFSILRGRAIHIHDELVYTDAAAFFGMNSLWDSVSQAAHFGSDGSEMTIAEHDTIVLVKQATNEVIITSTGRAIGHYARFIRRGAKRIDATSDDALVLISAFRDDTQGGRLVLVAINNAPDDRTLSVSLSGATFAGTLGGEQSTASAVWQAIPALTPSSASAFSLDVPGESVTTIATEGGGGAAGTGGAAGAGGSGGAATGGATSGGATASGGSNATGGSSAKPASGDDGGCSCRSAGSRSNRAALGFALSLAALALMRRRRR